MSESVESLMEKSHGFAQAWIAEGNEVRPQLNYVTGKGDLVIAMIPEWGALTSELRAVIVAAARRQMETDGATGYVFMAEAWMSVIPREEVGERSVDLSSHPLPSRDPKRRSVVSFTAGDTQGHVIATYAAITTIETGKRSLGPLGEIAEEVYGLAGSWLKPQHHS